MLTTRRIVGKAATHSIRVGRPNDYQTKRIKLKRNPRPSHCVNGVVSKSRRPPPEFARVGVANPTVTVLTEGDVLVDVVDDSELVDSVGLAVGKVMVGGLGIEREVVVRADVGVGPGAGVQF